VYYTGTVFEFDPVALSWYEMRGSAPTSRISSRMVVYNRKLVMFGGGVCEFHAFARDPLKACQRAPKCLL